MLIFQHKFLCLIFALSLLFLSACGVTTSVNETWSLITLLSSGEKNDDVIETVEVNNCGIPEPKVTECSAGTTNDLSFTGGLGGQVGVGGSVSLSGEVSSGLGIGKTSGENLSLEVPPDGQIYVYKIQKNFRVISGELLARSSEGDEEKVSYNFHASCSIHIVSRQTQSCPNYNPSSEQPQTVTPDTQSSTNELIHKQGFDDSNGSFDTNIWDCSYGGCNAQNIFQRDGMLVFKYNTAEIPSDNWGVYMLTRTLWNTGDLVSVEGKLQLGANSRGVAWLGIVNSGSCTIGSDNPDIETPTIGCYVGPNENREYISEKIPAKFDTWYSIRIDFDPITQEQRYYVDGKLIGQYKEIDLTDFEPLTIGVARVTGQSVYGYYDDIVVRTRH